MILLLASACNDYTITTKINADGTCERIIRIDSYSGNSNPETLPFYVDKTWNSRIEKQGKDTTQKTIIYSKTFASVDQLDKELVKASKIKSSATLEKKFRWFYTYFYYTEIYKKTNPFKQLPLDKFFSAGEIDSLNTGLLSKGLSKKVDDVFGKCILEEFTDSVSSAAKKYSIYDENKIRLLREAIQSDEPYNSDMLLNDLEKIYGSKSVRVMKPDIDRIFKNIETKIENYINPSTDISFTANIIMPGLILNTNAGSVEGNKLTWKPGSENYIFTDYKLTAESRVVNTWAVLITGLLVVLLILVLLIPIFRKRRSI
jgi:hypothetical protein